MLRRQTFTSSTATVASELSNALRSAATRSGPRAFKTDRQRRRVLRDESALDRLPLTPYELQRKNKLAPSSTTRGLDAVASSDVDNSLGPKQGRAYQVDHTLDVMRENVSAGPQVTALTADGRAGKLITAAIAKRKNAKIRRPMLLEQRQRQLMMEQQTLDQEGQGEQDENNNNASSSEQQQKDDENVWEPSKHISTRRRNYEKSNSENELSTSTTTATPGTEIFSPLTHAPTQIINDIDASRLDQIEQAKSNALAKRIEEMKPLPVFAGDEETMAQYLSKYEDGSSSGDAMEETLQATMKRVRLEKMEELSEKFLQKYDGDEVAAKEKFKKEAAQAKETFKGSDMESYVTFDYRGDEKKELNSLASQVQDIHRHNAFVKKRKNQLQKRREQEQILWLEKQQQQEKIQQEAQEKQEQQLEQNSSKNKELSNSSSHFDKNEFELQEELPKEEAATGALTVAEQEEARKKQNLKKYSNYDRPRSEFIEDAAGDTAILPTRLHYQKENQENVHHPAARIRKPTAEIVSLRHSGSNRHESAVATMAQLLPARRFEELELFGDDVPVVQQRGEISDIQEELYSDEKQTFAPIDATVGRSLDFLVRRSLMKFYTMYPINNMITMKRVKIASITDKDGKRHTFDDSERPIISLARGIAIAAEHGLDLMQIGVAEKNLHQAIGGTGGIALCTICDHLGHAMSDVEHFIVPLDGRVNAEQTRPLLEVGFRGVTHDFAFRFKSIYVAKFLFKRFPVRITLTKFGSPREGFPIMERVLNFIKLECERMKAYYISGQIRHDHSSIWVYLHPSTIKLPLSSIEATTPEQLMESMERAIFDAEYDREVTIPDSFTKRQAQAANRYDKERDEGTAWTWRSEGISIAQLRKQKIHQGMLPKGNKKLYALRGDVNMKYPFKTQSTTTTEEIGFPRESNLEQADRAAGVLHRRAEMSISQVHDQNELPNETHTLGNMDYVMTGDVFEMGAFKEALGIKTNRKRAPKMAQGFATVGQAEDDGVAGRGFEQM